MSRFWSPRDIVLLMAREIDPQESAPADDEYISEWVPEHSCDGNGDPGCAACWMQSYDARAGSSVPSPGGAS